MDIKSIAGRGLRKPELLVNDEIRLLCQAVLEYRKAININ